MLGSPAFAQSTWTGAVSNIYGAAVNWNPNLTPNTSSRSAIFTDGGLNTNVKANVTVTVNSWAFSGSTTSYSLTGSDITFAQGLTNTSSVSQTIANNLGGAGAGVIQDGTGTLTLSGANTYGGGTAIDAGTLRLGVNSVFNTPGDPTSGIVSSAVGTGIVVLNGGTLQSGINNITLANTILLTGPGGTIDNNNLRLTLTGPILDAPGPPAPGPLVLTGGTNGITIVSGNNGYAGGTTIVGTTVQARNASALGAGTITLHDGTFQAGSTGPMTITNNFSIDKTTTNGSTIDNNGRVLTLSGTISGDGALTLFNSNINGTGRIVLTGTNNYTGGTLVSSATVQVGNSSALGTGTVTLEDAGFQVASTGALTFANNFVINDTPSGSAIDNNGRTLTLTGNIGGDGALTFVNSNINGSGRTILLGTNTYTGGTTVCSCALVQLGDATHTASLTGTIFIEGELDILRADTTQITQVTNVGTLQFFNNTSASAMAIQNSASIQFNNTSTAGNASITNFSTVAFNNHSAAGSATFDNRGELSFFNNTSADASTINNNSGFVGFADSSTAGTATINNNNFGTIFFGTPSGTDAPTAGNATINNNAGGEIDFNAFSTGGSATITTNGGAATYFYDNSTGGNARLIANGTGIVDFSGTIGPNSDGHVSAGSIEGSGTFYIGPDNTLTVGSNNLSTTVSDVIADFNPCGCFGPGPGTLEKVGTGTMILSGINTYSGGTIFTGGTVSVSQDANLGSLAGGLTFNGGILQITGTSFTSTSRIITWGAAGGGFDIADPNNTFTVAQNLVGGGPLTKLGAGTLQLLGANSYTGGTTVVGGTLAISADNNIGTGPLAMLDGSTLRFLNGFTFIHAVTVSGDPTINVPFGAVTMSGVIADGATPGDVVKTGAGTLIFTANNTYTGGTAVFAGTLQLGTAATAGAIVGPVTVDANAFLEIVNATIPGVTTILNNGFIDLFNASTLGSATITNNSGIKLSDTASAGSATIANNGLGSLLRFFNSSMAGNAIITNTGFIQFSDSSSAASATITNSQNLDFFDTSTAGNATITNAVSGLIEFQNSSSAGSATLTNSGDLSFSNTTTAASATITNTADGSLSFFGLSTAANATIANNGFMFFYDTSSAANATITNNNSLQFNVTATAGSATIVTNDGAFTLFYDNSTGGNAQFITNAGGVTDFSGTVGPNGDGKITAGSIAGAGNYYLGSNQLTVGSNNLSTTVSGAISDCGATGEECIGGTTGGSLVKVGTGTLILTGTNIYTGGTTIDSGTLQLGNGGAGGSIVGNVTNNGIFAINRSDTYTFGGVISGTGALQQNGTGRTILTATSTYTGATTVNAGTLSVNGSIASSSSLTVNSGGTVGGTGTLPTTRINAGGTLSPGNSIGTITVAGNLTFVGAGNYLVEVSSTADRTNVTGTATLSGIVQAQFIGGALLNKYTILSAAGGLGGTTFNTLTTANLPAGFTPSLSYTPTDVILGITASLGQGSALPVNQQNVANTLNAFFNTNGTLPANFVTVFGLTGPSLVNGLSQISGEVATGAAVAGFQDMDQFLALMLDPFLENRVGTGTAPFGGPALAFAPEGAGASLPDAASAYARLPTKAPPLAPLTFDQRWTVWGAAYGASGSFDGSATLGSHDLTARSGGFAGGIDYRVGPNTVIGFAASGSSLSYSLDGGLGSGSGDAFKAGVYASTRFDNAYLSASAAYGNYDLSANRSIILPGAGDRLTSDVTAQMFGARIETGYRFPFMTASGITPYAAFQVQSFHLPRYGEADATGLAAFALTYNGHTFDEERGELGVRFDSRLAVSDNAILLLRGRLAWAHEFSGTPSLDATFVTLPGTAFTVYGASLPRDALLVSAGPELRLANGWTLRAKFDGSFSGQSQTYAGTGTLRYAW